MGWSHAKRLFVPNPVKTQGLMRKANKLNFRHTYLKAHYIRKVAKKGSTYYVIEIDSALTEWIY